MNNLNATKFAELLAGTCEIYDKQLTNSLVKAYYTMLSTYTDEEVTHGFSQHSIDPKHGSFFPKPADIVRHIDKTNEPAMSVSERAEIGWSDVYEKIAKIGPYNNFESPDKQVVAAVRSIGWKKMCSATYQELDWIKKEFHTIYSTYENTPLEHIPDHVAGLIEESKNKKQGQQALGSLLAQVDIRNNQKKLSNDNE